MQHQINFDLAPPVKEIDGLLAVPIDIEYMNAKVVFDLSSSKATVDAEMGFIMGIKDGNPVFDLRQDIIKARLNDSTIQLDKLRHHDFGGGSESELIILEKMIKSYSNNTLYLNYELKKPQCPGSKPIGWDPPRIYYEFWFTDLYPARYLEMWFPANLIYDQFKIKLEIEIINSSIEHGIISNGQVKRLSLNHWQVEFHKGFTSLSPMLCIIALDRIEYRQGILRLADTNSDLRLDIFKLKTSEVDLENVENEVKSCITKNVAEIGPYIHGDRFTTFLWDVYNRSMEYEGGITTASDVLKHEVFHSWFGRGIKPGSQNDGWIDEAWDVYNTSNGRISKPFDMSKAPNTLCSSNPFNRITPNSSYTDGARFFQGLAASLGTDNLDFYMSSFYKDNVDRLITTKQLESYLVEKSGISEISDYFNRFVYGL
jgi:hypothetical protein